MFSLSINGLLKLSNREIVKRSCVQRLSAWLRFAATAALCGVGLTAFAQKAATTTALTITSGSSVVTSVASGSLVTLTATVTAGGVAVVPGQVNFCDGSSTYCTDIHLLGTAQLTAGGKAVLKFLAAPGNHSYKAVFLGTNARAGSSSSVSSLMGINVPAVLATTTTVAKTGSWGNYQLTATVSEVGDAAPISGSVSFEDTSYGNAVLGASGLGTSTPGTTWLTAQTLAVSSVYGPSGTVTGDWNGDGIPDLAIATANNNTVAIELGNGDGTFTSALPITLTDPVAIAVGDFNGDGVADLAVVSETTTGGITILLGNGNGTFTPAAASPTVGAYSVAVVSADFNGDGIADLAVSNLYTGIVFILLGKGDGTFNSIQVPATNSAFCSSILGAGDFNGDGKTDLILAGSCSSVTLIWGNGDGTFKPGTTVQTALSGSSAVAVADLNGDGKLDIVVPIPSGIGLATILLGDGAGNFSVSELGPAIFANKGPVAVGDFNGDGIPDLALPDEYLNTVPVYFGVGDGTFVASPVAPPTGNEPGSIVVADFNHDGRVDMAMGNYFGDSATVLMTEPTQTASTAATPIAPAVAGQHLLSANYSGASLYMPSVSASTLLWGQPPATTTSLTMTSGGIPIASVPPGSVVTLSATVKVGASPLTTGQVSFCDATARDCIDSHLIGSAMLTSGGIGTFRFIPGPGQHSYKAVFAENALGVTSSSNALALTVTALPHVIASTTTTIAQTGAAGNYTLTATVAGRGSSSPLTGSVSFLDANHSNTTVAAVPLGTSTPGIAFDTASSTPFLPLGPIPTAVFVSIASGDFNGDGILDMAAVNPSGTTVTILLGNGNGTFTSVAGPTLTPDTKSVIAGDFNGDGKLDLAVTSAATTSIGQGTLAILLGNGDGTFKVSASAPVVGDFPQAFAAADFNGDGKLDLLVNTTTGTEVLLGNGDGTFMPALAVSIYATLAVADLNGDGFPDLVMSADAYGELVLLSNGDGSFRPVGAGLPPTPPNGVGFAVVGDFNGDGIPDLAGVWAYSSTISVFLGRGDGTFQLVTGPAYPTFFSPGGVAAADLNHDGKLDLVLTNLNGNPADLTILLGNGDGTFFVAPGNTQFAQTGAILAGNFNDDGIPDLVVATSSALSVLLTQPTETAIATVTGVNLITPGPHQVDASYPGDANYSASLSGTTMLLDLPPTPAVSFSLAGGTYHSPQTLALNDAVAGATIYFTYSTNGTAPTTASTVYTGPITVNSTGIVEAIALAPGYSESNNSSKAYVYVPEPAAPAPSFSLAGGTYHTPQTLVLTDSLTGATIHYTTNGTTPTILSTVYTGPITVASTELVEAAAIAPGYTLSPPGSKAYTYAPYPPATAPSFSLAGGTYATPQMLTLTDATANATIYYTTNGTAPTTSSTKYSGPITIASTELVEAVAIATGYNLSPVSAKAYTYAPLPLAAAPYFSLAGGHYTTPQILTLTDTTPGAVIYYTTNGTTPTTASTKYTGPITVSTTETIEAIAAATGYSNSNVSAKAYTIP